MDPGTTGGSLECLPVPGKRGWSQELQQLSRDIGPLKWRWLSA